MSVRERGTPSNDGTVYGQTDWGWATVVVVDDDETCRQLLLAMVRRFGVGRIIEAVDGIDCLDNIIGVVPDLIISDVSMPRMDGIELSRHIRSLEEFSDVPILIQTGSIGIDKHLSCFNAGASDVLTKPLRPSELRARMRVHLENRRLVYNLRKADQRITRELEGARRMQAALMPKPQRLQDFKDKYGVTIEGIVNPSFSIGGDFWGVIDIDDYAFGLYTVDFSGHGVMSALNTFRFHAVIGEITANRKDPASFLGSLNDTLVSVLPRGQYATFVYAVIDTLRGTITWSGAGAPFPLLFRDGPPIYIDSTGTPLGLDANSVYSNSMLPFPLGSGLFVYSDGMIEAVTHDGEQIGGVRGFFPPDGTPTSEIKLNNILNEFNKVAEQPLKDDLTAIWVRHDGGVRRYLPLDDRDDHSSDSQKDIPTDPDGHQTHVLMVDDAREDCVAKALRQSTAVVETGKGEFYLSPEALTAVGNGAILLSITTKSAYRNSPCVTLCNVLAERGWLLSTQHEDVLLALQEATANAVMHGNLELASPHGSEQAIRQYWKDLRERLSTPHLISRRVTILSAMVGTTLTICVEDQGNGFIKGEKPVFHEHTNSGRGESLMTSLATSVHWENGGRKVVLSFANTDEYA